MGSQGAELRDFEGARQTLAVEFRARPRASLSLGALGSLLLLLGAAAALASLPAAATPLGRFLLLLAAFCALAGAFLVGFLSFLCWNLRYRVADGALTVIWGPERRRVPLEMVEQVVSGAEVPEPGEVRGFRWLGYCIGRVGDTCFFSSHRRRDELLYVVTPSLAYALSPSDPAGLRAALTLGERAPGLREEVWRWRLLHASLWKDRLSWALMVPALAGGLFHLALVSYLYPALPALVPMHFTIEGKVDRVGMKEELFRLPAFGLSLLLADIALALLLHRNERLAALVVLGGGLLVQLLFLAGTLRIVA